MQSIDDVKATLDDFLDALRSKNTERVVSHYDPSNTMYVLSPPLQSTPENSQGAAGVQAWFDTFTGDRIDFEVRDLHIESSGEIAFAYFLCRMAAKKKEGPDMDIWVRNTLCFGKKGREWKITHQHESVPFYMDGSLRAAIDLKP